MRGSLSRMVLVFSLALGAAAAPFLSCGTQTILPVKDPDKCTLQIVGITVIASPRINPDPSGEARPVQLRLYQLKTDSRLLPASFDDIWQDDKKTLHDDLVKVDQFPVYPDSRTEVKFERDGSALFVAAVALFRNATGRSWYTVFELPPAPGKGNCGMPTCSGPECDAGGTAPSLNPRFSIWIDGSRITEGDDHLDEYPDGGRVRELRLHSAPAASSKGGN